MEWKATRKIKPVSKRRMVPKVLTPEEILRAKRRPLNRTHPLRPRVEPALRRRMPKERPVKNPLRCPQRVARPRPLRTVLRRPPNGPKRAAPFAWSRAAPFGKPCKASCSSGAFRPTRAPRVKLSIGISIPQRGNIRCTNSRARRVTDRRCLRTWALTAPEKSLNLKPTNWRIRFRPVSWRA